MLPVAELMNIPDATFVKSTQSSATTEQMTPLIRVLRTIGWNVAYGCHTELARFDLSIFTRGGDCLTSGQSYMSLMRFIDPNWDTNIVHKSPMRVNKIHSPVLFRVESTTSLGHTYKCSASHTHSSQAKWSMFQHKTTNEIHENQHTLTLPMDS